MTEHTDTGWRTAMIERIAQAIYDAGAAQVGSAPPWRMVAPHMQHIYRDAAQAALTAIMGEGDGVQQSDRDAAADLYLDQIGDEDGFADRIRANTAQPGCDAWEQAFARHRSTAAAAERARIVASLRDTPWPYRNDALADAIERGEV